MPDPTISVLVQVRTPSVQVPSLQGWSTSTVRVLKQLLVDQVHVVVVRCMVGCCGRQVVALSETGCKVRPVLLSAAQ